MNYDTNYQLGNYAGARYYPRVEHNIKAWKEILFAFWMHPYSRERGVPAFVLVRKVPKSHPTSSAKGYVRWLAKEGYIVPFRKS
jgi:hypothetical protein